MMAVTRKMKGIEEEEEEEEQMKKKKKTVKENVEDGVTWRRGKMIGKGSFGSVYLATLKKPPPNKSQLLMAVKSAELSVSKSLQEERKVFNNLQGCPYIIQCFGEETTTSQTGETVYNLLLEYASGGSLRDLIEKSNGFGLQDSDVRRYARSILRAIKHVHDSGYVHLDLKPDNILLVPTKSKGKTTTSTPATTEVKAANNKNKKFMAKVCDFGLAKMVKQQINKKNSKKKKKSESSYYYLRGTALYMSPEAVADGIQEAPSDIWAIGCVVLEMLTGKRVWDRKVHGNTEKLLYNIGYGSDLPEIPSSISEEGKDFLKGCFVRKPADRLTADMLLKLPFVSQAEEDDDEEDAQKVEVLNLNLKESLDAQGVSTMLSLSETDDEDDSWLVEPTMMSEDNNDSSSIVDEPRIISEEEEKEEPSICCEYDNDCLMDEPGIIPEDEEEPSICPSSEAEALEGVDADDEHEEVEASLKKGSDTQGASSMSDTDNDSDEDETIEEEEDEDHSISPSSEALEDVDEDAKAEVLKWGSFDPKEVNSGLCLSDESWSDESSSVPEAEDHKKRPVSLAMDDETTTQDHKRRKRMMPSSVAGLKQIMIEYFIANHQPKPVKAIPQKPPSTLPTTAAH
ncbi:mitogen-activated protein kinase kinase kinase ANP1-like [Camellia sinensis]|nr:mitogen-activated protein kinase kinase kinase ANP1-like [Camellia sinensis]